MNRFIPGASAALLLGFTAIAGVTPAAAATTRNFQQQDQYIGTYCGANQNAKGCNDWQTQHSQWSQSQYQGFYRSHQNDNGFGNTAAAGLFGLAVGAAAVGVMSNGNTGSHVQDCERTYHSYDVRTNTYLGYDGLRHACEV